MNKEEIEKVLSNILDKENENLKEPSDRDWVNLENKFGCKFPKEFISFIELMSKYMFPGDILNVSTGKTNGNDTIELTYNYEVKQGTFPKELIPFYGIGNGDYFCLHSKECPNTNVYYYSHEEQSFEKDSDSFMQWVKQLPDFLN